MYKFISIYKNIQLFTVLIFQLILMTIVLYFDVRLVNWYQDFYNAVLIKQYNPFIKLIIEFTFIVSIQAIILSLNTYLGDIHEALLKKFFSSLWIEVNNFSSYDNIIFERVDQKIIDDSMLASERLAHFIPELIYQFSKAVFFLYLLQQFSIFSILSIQWSFFINPIVFFGLIYVLIQLILLKNSRFWISRTEKMKRELEANLRYKIISRHLSFDKIKLATNNYIKSIFSIRHIVARAHSLNLLIINILSNYSIIIPMFISFQSFIDGYIDFGEFMKIGATYSGFQNAFIYILSFYKNLFQGISAVNRLIKI